MKNPAFKTYILGYIILLGLALIYLLGTEKGAFVLWLNGTHTPWLDLFMKYFTYFGYAIWYFILIVALFFYRIKYAITLIVIGLATTVIFQSLRHLVFDDSLRPAAYFADMQDLTFVDGVRIYGKHSFPSGHSTTAFALGCFLSLINRSKWIGALLLTMAVIVGVSRIYLALHFLEDVIVGSLFGILITIAGYMAIASVHKFWYNPKWDKPLSFFRS
jgi:membrane-associated phospholipid phosphatase